MTKNQVLKGMFAAVGILIPSVFTYLAAKSGNDEAKIRAQIAYETLAESVNDLQDLVKELNQRDRSQDVEIAQLRGQLEGRKIAGSSPLLPTAAPADPNFAPKSKLRRPPDFSQAIEDFKAKK